MEGVETVRTVCPPPAIAVAVTMAFEQAPAVIRE